MMFVKALPLFLIAKLNQNDKLKQTGKQKMESFPLRGLISNPIVGN